MVDFKDEMMNLRKKLSDESERPAEARETAEMESFDAVEIEKSDKDEAKRVNTEMADLEDNAWPETSAADCEEGEITPTLCSDCVETDNWAKDMLETESELCESDATNCDTEVTETCKTEALESDTTE